MNFDTTDKLHEECGIFGMSCPPDEDRDPALAAYNALFALQHRGQESCGITVNRNGELVQHKNPGLVPDVFTPEILESLSGAQMAIGHVRYASDNSSRSATNAQPITIHHASGSMALCYNGKLVNSKDLRAVFCAGKSPL